MTPLTRFRYTIFRLGMTRGMYDLRRGQFTCATAALSADIPIVDALPYRLVFRVRAGPAGFRRKSKVLKKNNKYKIENKGVLDKPYPFNLVAWKVKWGRIHVREPIKLRIEVKAFSNKSKEKK